MLRVPLARASPQMPPDSASTAYRDTCGARSPVQDLTNENHKRELVPEISSSASLTQLSLDRGTVLHTVLGEPDTGMQAAASLRALQPPPSGMKPPRVITPQGPHPTPVRPPVLRTPLPVSYLEEEPLERLVLGRGMWPPIPRAKLSHPVCLAKGRLRHALGTGYVPPGCLPANQSTHPVWGAGRWGQGVGGLDSQMTCSAGHK